MYKICVVTATRAEYGVMRRMLKQISEDTELQLQLIVTGTHLSEQYGRTVQEIEQDCFEITKKVDIQIVGNDVTDIANSMAIAQKEFVSVFQELKPDCLIVVGDRYELLPICSSAVLLQIPIAHISGGEVTVGAIDDVIRHCITKMSYLHFPACEEYRKRIIQMGEAPDRVFNFGDIGMDALLHMEFMKKEQLEESLAVKLIDPYVLVTFHPVTMERDTDEYQLEQMLQAVDTQKDTIFLFTKANADMGGNKINEKIEAFCENRDNCYLFDSLGSRRYLSLLKNAAYVLGNSSSGLYEAPAFQVPTINIGNRQKGRIKLKSVLDCQALSKEIIVQMKRARDPLFRQELKMMENPFVGENMVENMLSTIKDFLKQHKINLQKIFYDIV